MRWLAALRKRLERIDAIESRLGRMQESIGRIESRQLQDGPARHWREHEFRVFSQWGEDGLIQHLVREIPVPNKIFVEFGVENYLEANTRFLVTNDGWSGLLMDSAEENVRQIRQDSLYWQSTLSAQQAFVSRENINSLLAENGICGPIGLMSIDIDGNDYWVWEAITVARPAIVIIEYNARFGPDRAVTIPYDPDFNRQRAHYSMIYYGASLRALWWLGKQKNYALVGCNGAGNNAFFVSKDFLPGTVKTCEPKDAYVAARFRESRDCSGNLAYLDPAQEAQILEALPVVEVEKA